MRILTGGVLHPMGAYLLHRSLPTLPFRVREAEKRAQIVAERLAADPRVTRVLFPGLPGHDPRACSGASSGAQAR